MLAIAEYLANGSWTTNGDQPHNFPSLTVTYNLDGFIHDDAAISALGVWAAATGMSFIRTSDPDADIIFTEHLSQGAFTLYEASHGLTVQATINVAPVFAGTLGLQWTMLHEIGHALGLGHPKPFEDAVPGITSDETIMSLRLGNSIPTEPRPIDIEAWDILYSDLSPVFARPENRLIGGADAIGGVDETWYATPTHNRDVYLAGVDPSDHFDTFGWKEDRDPNAYFDLSYYLDQNPDVRAAGVNPLRHYEQFGWQEGRNPSRLFDTDAYLAANPDVATAGVNPLEHYLVFGLDEGRPSWLVT